MTEADNTESGCIEMGVFLLRQLGALFDAYRNKGIYDDAMIVVLSDHGHHEFLGRFSEVADGELPGTAKPFLWVKPSRCSRDFKTSTMPTSHARVAALLREACNHLLSPDDINTILYESQRLYRKVYIFDSKKEDWLVGAAGEITKHGVSPMGDESVCAELTPVSPGYLYSFDFEGRDDYVGKIQTEHLLGRGEDLCWYPYQTNAAVRFRVPDPGKKYVMKLFLKYWYPSNACDGRGVVRFFQDNPSLAVCDWEPGPRHLATDQVLLEGLVPDKNGEIRVVGIRRDGLPLHIYFTHLQVDEVPNE